MSATATIGTRTPDDCLEVVETLWDHNGTMRVTVRELIGGSPSGDSWVGGLPLRRMRTLARRCSSHPELTTSSRVVGRFYSGSCVHVTFAVSRLPR